MSAASATGMSKAGAGEPLPPAGFLSAVAGRRRCGVKRSAQRTLEIAGIHFRRFETDSGVPAGWKIRRGKLAGQQELRAELRLPGRVSRSKRFGIYFRLLNSTFSADYSCKGGLPYGFGFGNLLGDVLSDRGALSLYAVSLGGGGASSALTP